MKHSLGTSCGVMRHIFVRIGVSTHITEAFSRLRTLKRFSEFLLKSPKVTLRSDSATSFILTFIGENTSENKTNDVFFTALKHRKLLDLIPELNSIRFSTPIRMQKSYIGLRHMLYLISN
ncbi:hypothetical protein NPIL_679421 [Nephila pilipes]|uniref:Uncharacterized protein n=1 Tax=Nephila pilipes TaxID=299642 RepID=A0A8X6NL97_NEPPI|nr:hypothetical protein NPIL_679421 [Nephila pilipes]